MTINSATRKAGPYVGNGSADTFAFNFKVFSASDVVVKQLEDSTSIETTLSLTTNYTVTLNQDQNGNPGGSIKLTAGNLATGFRIVITSDVNALQGVDLTNQGGFFPEIINDALDKAVILHQEQQEKLNRSLNFSLTNTIGSLEITQNATTRANKVISFDETGELALTNAAPTAFLVGSSPPSDPPAGSIWYDTVSGRTFVYYQDVDTKQWVEANPPFDAAEAVQVASQINFLPSGTNAVTRTVDSKLKDVVSVKDFGAVGDGTTNDTTAFINAINSGATTIFIPEGTYRTGDVVDGTTRTIEINNKNNITLQGANKATTIIKKNNSINQQVIAFSNNQNIAVKGLTIDGNSANNTSGHGIRLSNVDGVVIEDVIIQNIDAYAIGLQDGSNRNININRFDIRNIDNDAIDIKEKDNANVSNNIIISNGSISNFGILHTDKPAIDIRGAVTISNVNIEFNNSQNIGLRLRQDGTHVSDSDPTQTEANGGPAAVAISNVYMFGDIEAWKPNVEYKIINPFYNENSHPVHGTKTLVLNKDTNGNYSVYEATTDHALNEIAPTHTTGTVNGWGRIRQAYQYTGLSVEPKTATVIADGAQDYASGNFVINDNKTYRANATITDNSHTPTHTTLGQVVSNWMFVGPANDPITEHVFNNIFIRNADLGYIQGNGGLYNNLVNVNGVTGDSLDISGENNTFIGLKIRKPFQRPIDILPDAKNNRILGFHLSGYATKIRTGTGANYTANDYVIATNNKTYKANTTITNNSVDPTHSSGTTGNWDYIAGAHADAIRIQGGATNTVISGGHIDEGMRVNIGETGTVVIRDVLNFDTTSNLISADVAVDSTGEKTVIIAHNLTKTPNDEDISTSLVRSTGNPNDFALDYPPLLYFKNSTNIAFKIKVGTASATSGARIKIAVLIRARQS